MKRGDIVQVKTRIARKVVERDDWNAVIIVNESAQLEVAEVSPENRVFAAHSQTDDGVPLATIWLSYDDVEVIREGDYEVATPAKGFAVTLAQNISDENSQQVADLLKLIKGVADVQVVSDSGYSDHVNRERVRQDMRLRLWKALENE